MNKKTLLAQHGKKKTRDVSGILHNYTLNGTTDEAYNLEHMIRKYGSQPLEKVIQHFDGILEFEA